MQRSTAGGNNFEDGRQPGDREPVVGDADGVQKTSYVVGHGTDPDAPDARGASASVRSGGGINLGLWAVAAVAIVLALIYGLGLFT